MSEIKTGGPVDLNSICNRASLARKICNVSIGLVDKKVVELCDDIDYLVEYIKTEIRKKVHNEK